MACYSYRDFTVESPFQTRATFSSVEFMSGVEHAGTRCLFQLNLVLYFQVFRAYIAYAENVRRRQINNNTGQF